MSKLSAMLVKDLFRCVALWVLLTLALSLLMTIVNSKTIGRDVFVSHFQTLAIFVGSATVANIAIHNARRFVSGEIRFIYGMVYGTVESFFLLILIFSFVNYFVYDEPRTVSLFGLILLNSLFACSFFYIVSSGYYRMIDGKRLRW